MVTRPVLRQMEVERQIILEEMLDEVDEKGRDIDLDNLSKLELFNGHPLALKIAGTSRSVKSLNLEHLREHLAHHYASGNLVFAAAGNADRAQVFDLVEQSCRAQPT